MKYHSELPDLQTLTSTLTSVMREHLPDGASLAVLDREPNIYAPYHSHSSEFVTCKLGADRQLRLFIKYSGCHGRENPGRERGPAYEATVYRRVLRPLEVSTPTFYGVHREKAGGTWLVLQGISEARHAGKGSEESLSMRLAARWIGRLHASYDRDLPSSFSSFLEVYDAEYYRRWSSQTLQFSGGEQKARSWLPALCRRFEEEVVEILLEQQPTVVHGDYWADNVLFSNGIVYPLDWESAALAVGEIDLACLTTGWHEELVKECEAAYQQARWPDGPPAGFARVLAAAHIYVCFRLLGEAPGWPNPETRAWRVDQLFAAAEQLGLH